MNTFLEFKDSAKEPKTEEEIREFLKNQLFPLMLTIYWTRGYKTHTGMHERGTPENSKDIVRNREDWDGEFLQKPKYMSNDFKCNMACYEVQNGLDDYRQWAVRFAIDAKLLESSLYIGVQDRKDDYRLIIKTHEMHFSKGVHHISPFIPIYWGYEPDYRLQVREELVMEGVKKHDSANRGQSETLWSRLIDLASCFKKEN